MNDYSNAVSEYRKQNRLSLRAMADILGTSTNTVWRIEKGDNIRASEKLECMLKEIAANYEKDSLSRINEEKSGLVTDNDKEIEDFYPYISSALSRRGYEVDIDDIENGQVKWFAFGKSWVIEFTMIKSEESFLNAFYKGIGQAVWSSPNKYSLIAIGAFDTSYLRKINYSSVLNMDVSILCFDPELRDFVTEIDLITKRDGNGMFDIDVPERATDAKEEYANWKTSLG